MAAPSGTDPSAHAVAGRASPLALGMAGEGSAASCEEALFASDEFRMYCYKVLPCAKRTSHEWTSCPWAHPGEKARRRDPRVYSYLAIPCPDTKQGGVCPRGDDCPNCHSLFEYWLHPSRYRTQLCRNNDGSACKRQICFFAHSIDELRVPDHSHLHIPAEMLQQQAGSAAGSSGDGSWPGSPKASTASGSSASSSPKAGGRKDKRHGKGTKGNSASTSPRSAGGRAASPAAAAAALPRAQSLDAGAGAAGARAADQALHEQERLAAAMAADPEVPEPCCSPHAAAAALQQLMLQQLQRERLEAASYGQQQLQLLMAAEAQAQAQLAMQAQAANAAAWASAQAAATAANGPLLRLSSLPECPAASGYSPPLSPAPSSLRDSTSASSFMEGDVFMGLPSSGSVGSCYTPSYAGSYAGAGWAQPGLLRTLSGPPALYSPAAGGKAGAAAPPLPPAYRGASLDPSQLRGCGLPPPMLRCSPPPGCCGLPPSGYAGSPGASPARSAPLAPQGSGVAALAAAEAGGQPALDLGVVAGLVDSVNRGEMGECGNEVLTGVIGLLMQQLHLQQPHAA